MDRLMPWLLHFEQILSHLPAAAHSYLLHPGGGNGTYHLTSTMTHIDAATSTMASMATTCLPVLDQSSWVEELLWGLALIWFGGELAFFLVIRHVLVPQLNRVRRPPPSALDGKTSMLKVLSTVHRLHDVYGFEEFFKGWFKGMPMSQLKDDNVKDFLGWTTYHKRWGRLTDEEQGSVEEVMEVMRVKYGLHFEEGYNPACKFVCMNLEPLHFVHRPIIFYLLIKAVQQVGGMVLRWQGFRRYYTRHGVRYWYRKATSRPRHHRHSHQLLQHTSTTSLRGMARTGGGGGRRGNGQGPPSPDQQQQASSDMHLRMPLVFFHGISPGLCVYLSLISRLMTRDRPCVLVEIPHITMLLHFQASRKDVMVTAMRDIVKRHDLKALAVAGHSFGSIAAGWVTAAMPDLVKQLILIDPVCLLLCFPDVAYNFLYRMPVTVFGRALKAAFGIAKELTVSYALRRNFWWHENIVWLEDVRCPVLVALSEQDGIAPIPAVREYVIRHHQDHKRRHSKAGGAGASTLRLSSTSLSPARDSSLSISLSGTRSLESPGRSNSVSSSAGGSGGPVDAQVLVWKSFTHGRVLFSAKAQRQLLAAMREQARQHATLPPATPRFA